MRAPLVALAFALAAAFAAWNPLAAPFGLVVGIAAVVLASRALRAPRLRAVAAGALGVAVLAVLGAAVVLALTAGVGRGPGGADVVTAPPPEDVRRAMDEAAEATREARERAARELPAPADGGEAGPGQPPRR